MTLPPPKPLIGDIWRYHYSEVLWVLILVDWFTNDGHVAARELQHSDGSKPDARSRPIYIATLQRHGHLLIRNGQIYRGVQDQDAREHRSQRQPDVEFHSLELKASGEIKGIESPEDDNHCEACGGSLSDHSVADLVRCANSMDGGES